MVNYQHHNKIHALYEVVSATQALFRRLTAVVDEIHGQGPHTGGRRGVLNSLDREGPQTVPQLARARPVSRQHMQSHVNELKADGLVELIENPAHKRSRLVRLTAEGKQLIDAMRQREVELFQRLETDLSAQHLTGAARVLDELRSALESPAWQRLIAKR